MMSHYAVVKKEKKKKAWGIITGTDLKNENLKYEIKSKIHGNMYNVYIWACICKKISGRILGEWVLTLFRQYKCDYNEYMLIL